MLTDVHNSQDWQQLLELVNRHQRFLISSHIRPDGDAIGASLAMKRILERMGKDAQWIMDEEVGVNYHCFFKEEELTLFDPQSADFPDRDAVIMVDAGEWFRLGRVGEAMQKHPGDKICIDHHIPQNHFDGVRILDTHSPTTTVLIYRFVQFLKMDFDLSLAEPIYLGLIVDTQNFHLPNTTEEAHHIAAHCLSVGVQPYEVHEPVFGVTRFSRLRLMSEALHTLETCCDGKMGSMYTTREMFRTTKADPIDDDGFVDFVRTVEGVRVGVYLREMENGEVKVSWRGKGDNNIVVSAHKFGGGGHMRAAGATVQGSMEEVRRMVLEDLQERYGKGEIG